MALLPLVLPGEKLMPAAWRFDRIVGGLLLGTGFWVAINIGLAA